MTNYPPPFRPLRGAAPPHFVDREDSHDVLANGIVASTVAACAAGPCDPRFHRLVVAAPAMGKTALLRAIGREVACRLGWAVTLHSCRAKERALRAVSAAVDATVQARWAHAPTGQSSEMFFVDRLDQEPASELSSGTRADVPSSSWPSSSWPSSSWASSSWAALRDLLAGAGERARSMSSGLLVMFDDADRLGGAELDSLGCLARTLSRAVLPVALVFSGGPQLGHRFARAGHYSGCIWLSTLGRLDDAEAREALVVPAADGGLEFDEEALELLCHAAAGCPLELQRLGFAAWSATGGAGVVTLAVARRALDLLMEATEARAS